MNLYGAIDRSKCEEFGLEPRNIEFEILRSTNALLAYPDFLNSSMTSSVFLVSAPYIFLAS